MNIENFKQQCLDLIEKTGNPIAPLQMKQFQNGIEQGAKLFSPLCKHENVLVLVNRLLKDFTDEELEQISPALIIAAIAIAKQSTIEYTSSKRTHSPL